MGVEKFGVGKFMVEKSRVEMSFNLCNCSDLKVVVTMYVFPHEFFCCSGALLSVMLVIRVRPRFFDQVGHETMYVLVETLIFSLNPVIVRPTKIMNRADKNWAHF